ncbi:MAG: excinuclease ABC subunit UvrA, partial [bacterium]
GKIHKIDEIPKLEKNKKHEIEVVVDRLVINSSIHTRLADSIETALQLSSGVVIVQIVGGEERLYSAHYACVHCSLSYEEPSPRMFSFNSPYGACPACNGLGSIMKVDAELVVPDPNKSLNQGAIVAWGQSREGWYFSRLQTVAKAYGFSLDTPFKDLTEEQRKIILYGAGDKEFRFKYTSTNSKIDGVFINQFEGVINNLERRYHQTTSQGIRNWIEKLMNIQPCPECGGGRLKKESLSVKVNGKSIYDITTLSIKQVQRFFENLKLNQREAYIARQILKEIKERLIFLTNVGLDYLTIDRQSGTLSGGEAQRIRLATQIGSQLVGVLYILDEPSIGLHQRDNNRLIKTLTTLRDLGNSVVVVEHDKQTIESADFVIDLGPGAGIQGGTLVALGSPERIKKAAKSITGQYLSGKRSISVPEKRRKRSSRYLTIYGAAGNNLKSIDVKLPLGLFVCITGVSGSGKSSLINETLYPVLLRKFYRSSAKHLAFRDIEGIQHIDKV